MKASPKSLLAVIPIGACLLTFSVQLAFGEADPLSADATDAAVTSLTSKILESSQFTHKKLNDELAGRFLDRYLDSLDGGHMIFLQSDLEEFAGFRPTLAEATRDQGDSHFSHIIFKR